MFGRLLLVLAVVGVVGITLVAQASEVRALGENSPISGPITISGKIVFRKWNKILPAVGVKVKIKKQWIKGDVAVVVTNSQGEYSATVERIGGKYAIWPQENRTYDDFSPEKRYVSGSESSYNNDFVAKLDRD